MKIKTYPVEVLKFRNGDSTAILATNGERHVSCICESMKEHEKLSHGIGYLVSRGFSIVTDEFQTL